MPSFPKHFSKKNHKFVRLILLIIAFLLATSNPPKAEISVRDLKQYFRNPPADAKPMMRWWWFGAAVEKPEILRELQQMKADGIGGIELAFVYPQVLDDPAKGLKNLPFLSPAFLDCVHYTKVEAKKLGLRVDITLGSGWPYGGPSTTLEEAAAHLHVAEIPLPANATSLPKLKLMEGESIISVFIANGEPKHWDAASSHAVSSGDSIVATASNPRVALFFISSHTRQQVKRAAVGAEGWVLDPFSHQAVATHLKAVAEPLVKAFGDTPPYAVFSDSLEAYGADWTPNLPAEFLKRRGYDLVPYLPALVTGGTPEAEKIRHDWGKTLTELVDENYLIQINTWAVAHHTKFRSQTYGDPAVTLSSQHLVSLPEGEGPQWRAFSTLRWATSANHILGNNVSSGETFTWLHSPVFRATPLDMKAEADIAFIMGENQIIGHGWPYSPPQVSEPGWSLYAAAVFNDHNPWHPVMYDVTRYIQRISFLLRQGQPANQVALLLPTDDAWASFSPGQVSVTGAMQHLIKPQLMSAILSAGYNIDFIDPDAINRLGIHYPILVIPPTDRIPLETLRKIQQYTTAGGKVISVGGAPSLNSEGKSTAEITTLSRQLFDTAKFTQIANESALADALHTAAKPDLRLIESSDPTHADKLGFIRRRLPNADIYFVANTSNQPIQQSIDFATKYLSGSTLDPDTGESANQIGNSHDVKLTLAPYESRAFIFDNSQSLESPQKSDAESQLADLSSGWKVTFTSTGISHIEPTLTDWTANPDTKFYSGEAVYTRDFILPSATRNPTYLQIEGGSPIPGNSSSPPEHGLPDQKITLPGPGMRAYYDPPIREAAVVVINGQLAGSLWHPPYRLKVSPYLKPGQNHIEIHIYNTAINAWAAQPPRDYKPLIEKFGDRFQMQDLDKVRPIPSGLLGTVHLIVRSNE